nr:hypothetical protein [Mitsuokella multacida]
MSKDQGDTEALASDEYKNAATDEAKNAIKQKYEAKYIHAANIAAMDKDGTSAGVTNYDTDYTYGNDSTYNYAGSQTDGVNHVTAGTDDTDAANVGQVKAARTWSMPASRGRWARTPATCARRRQRRQFRYSL